MDGEELGDHVLDAFEGFYAGNLSNTTADLTHFWGAHFTLCDGLVRFLNYTLDQEIFTALTTRNGGEVAAGY